MYKRKLLQVQRAHRSKFLLFCKEIENVLDMTITRVEYAWEKKEELEHIALSRRTSLEENNGNETEETA